MKPPKFFNERWASKGPRPPTYFYTLGSNRLFRYNNGRESNGLSRFCKRFFFGLKKILALLTLMRPLSQSWRPGLFPALTAQR